MMLCGYVCVRLFGNSTVTGTADVSSLLYDSESDDLETNPEALFLSLLATPPGSGTAFSKTQGIYRSGRQFLQDCLSIKWKAIKLTHTICNRSHKDIREVTKIGLQETTTN
jgi:hypothetical protein